MVLASWKKLVIPKSQGGWGLKNIFLFSKALVAKNVWRLIQGSGLWAQVIKDKYISPESIEEWVRKPIRHSHNASIIWKVVVMAFPLIGNWLVWKIGRGNKVQIGLDPWIGSNDAYRLPHHLVMDLKSQGYHTLKTGSLGS
jgi:hypothetical protein